MWGLGSATANPDGSVCGAKWTGTTAEVMMFDAIPKDADEQAWPGGQRQPHLHLPSVDGVAVSALAFSTAVLIV